MASGNITKSSLISQAHENVKSLIDNRSNVSDPIQPNPGGLDKLSKFVYTKQAKIFSTNFKGYPFIIVKKPIMVPSVMSLSSSRARIDWEIIIEVMCSDNIRGNSDKGAAYTEQIVDDILETLNDTSNKNTLRNFGMAHFLPAVEDFDTIDLGNESIFVARLTIPFRKRLDIS